MPRPLPISGEKYKHFNENVYRVICVARHSETGEVLVVYEQADDPTKKWIRPAEMFMSKVDKEKYPDVEQEYRFERI